MGSVDRGDVQEVVIQGHNIQRPRAGEVVARKEGQNRGQARGRVAVVYGPVTQLVSHVAVDRRMDLLYAPDAGGRR